ncbi:hypothetical protein A0J61_02832 [Choanephora cucurbitarum]|uniref:Uncharacterized protein n=1 Tax=Choanephora cucurbitarum TaxID=101091 RepID=A0A1C7NKV5_9FUNG|nr:hypothetical protein A0J61_02832 [Choanephora cucurbitarum]
MATDLGVVKPKKVNEDGESTVEVEIPMQQKDLNAIYMDACNKLTKEVVPQKQHRDSRTKQEDYYRSFRTRFVLAWIVSNLTLVVLITSVTTSVWIGTFEDRSTAYLGFILWSVAAIAAIRFVGSVAYVTCRLFGN